MRSNRPKSLATAILLLACASAHADAIRPNATATGTRVAPAPEVARSGPRTADPLSLSPAMIGAGRSPSPIDRQGVVDGLAASSLPRPSDTPPLLDRPELPRESLIGIPAEAAGWEQILRDPEVASDSTTGHNVRIPEPASLTLVAAGLIGLTARNRLRRGVLSRKAQSRRVD